MNRFKYYILGAAALALVPACSSSDRVVPEPTASQTLPLASQGFPFAAPNLRLVPATLSDAGRPVSTPPSTGVSGPTQLAAGALDANAARLALNDPRVLAKLRGIALGRSSAAGVLSPKTMRLVTAADRQAAQTILSGAVINDHAPVYVIKMTGGPFTATQHPPGAAAPQANVLTVTIDPTTYRVTDVGYDDVEPDLAQVGSLPVDL